MTDGTALPTVTRQDPGTIARSDLDRLVEILSEGGAVDPVVARDTLPQCQALLIARAGDQIVGLGAIKPPRPGYTASVQWQSKTEFDPSIPELGYVAVAKSHKGRKISRLSMQSLLNSRSSPVFCTTDAAEMRHMLPTFDFVRVGKPWNGKRDELSCWVSPDLKWRESSHDDGA